jgi:hypothetical protein
MWPAMTVSTRTESPERRRPQPRSMIGLTWGLIAAATLQAWRDDGCSGRARGWVWTERAVVVDAVVAALLAAAGVILLRPIDIVRWGPFWIMTIALLSWWITGRFGPGRDHTAAGASNAPGSQN